MCTVLSRLSYVLQTLLSTGTSVYMFVSWPEEIGCRHTATPESSNPYTIHIGGWQLVRAHLNTRQRSGTRTKSGEYSFIVMLQWIV